MKLLSFIINTNIFISLAAVGLSVETQVQLGLQPAFHPYLFIIFFATIFEYNLHRLITVIKNPQALEDDKHKWVKSFPLAFYLLVGLSVAGFVTAVLFAKREVLLTLLPIGLVTLLYSLPVVRFKKRFFRLRDLPLVKIFLISLVWSATTVLLPVIQSGTGFDSRHIAAMLAERFLFVFSITIPFDIRDMAADKGSGLNTLPLMFGEKRSLLLADATLALFLLIALPHCVAMNQVFLLPALIISAVSTYIFIHHVNMQKLRFYHYFILDGTMLLQSLLVYIAFIFNKFPTK